MGQRYCVILVLKKLLLLQLLASLLHLAVSFSLEHGLFLDKLWHLL